MTWHALMIELLLEERTGGELDFARAWRHAAARARAQGVGRPRDYLLPPSELDPGWLPFSSFFRVACEREWRGLVYADYAGLREALADSGLPGARTEPAPARHGGAPRVRLVA